MAGMAWGKSEHNISSLADEVSWVETTLQVY